MAEIGGGGKVPHGEDADHFPRDVGQQANDEGGVCVGLVELVVGDDESGGEVIEIGSECTPPMHVGAREHVELGNPKGAIVDDSEVASELVLNHFELRFQIDGGAAPGAFRSSRIHRIPEGRQGQ